MRNIYHMKCQFQTGMALKSASVNGQEAIQLTMTSTAVHTKEVHQQRESRQQFALQV